MQISILQAAYATAELSDMYAAVPSLHCGCSSPLHLGYLQQDIAHLYIRLPFQDHRLKPFSIWCTEVTTVAT